MSRRKGHGGGHAEEHPDERWLVSYADMITVLMCLFLVLFAMSTVDSAKYEKLKNSLATGFGDKASKTADTATGVIVPKELIDKQGQGFTAATDSVLKMNAAKVEVASLSKLRDKMKAQLASKGLSSKVSFDITDRGLAIKLIGGNAFFAGNSANLRAEAKTILNTIGPYLAKLPNKVSVEGHADRHGSSFPFPTDWELSAGRSTAVLRYLVETNGVPPSHAFSVSYGSAQPSSASAAENRRVDVVVLSNEPEAIRALIPQVLAQK
jgi:chemotaxis protein MotB